MIPELGHLTVVLALCMVLPLAVVPLIGAARDNLLWMSYARPLAWGQLFFLLLSFFCLIYAFVTDDFSVVYVANHSNTNLPVQYKVSAVWGGHEGSLLLWVLILAAWTFAVSVFSRKLPMPVVARVLSVMGMISIGFLLFVILTSNPFARHLPNSPVQGSELNPLLQDIGLILHPPLLYMGYVGFSVAFAFALAALIGGRLDGAWARWSRPWTNIAWVFLTLGIAMGSYWAYYELGWGGWWFWDPVENASFMPWLVGTALIHSLAVTDKRGAFKSWTVLLAISAFSLSLLGTFLVRSGVLTSVHAFANDPERGLFILVFLFVVVGGSLTLYAIRAPAMAGKPLFALWSREVLLLMNNVILVVAAVTVLLGTLYPLLIDALDLGRISVGPPYFNATFIPLMCLLFALMGFAPDSSWKQSSKRIMTRRFAVALISSLAIGLLFPALYGDEFSPAAVLTLVLALWLVSAGVNDLLLKQRQAGRRGLGVLNLSRLSLSYLGMQLAHLGMAVSIIGVGFTSVYTEHRDVRVVPGDAVELAGYRFIFDGVKAVQGPNYLADEGQVRVFRNGEERLLMKPQRRFYQASRQTMTEAYIDTGFTRDLYVVLGESQGEDAWALRVHYKAFVNWIWFGSLMMALGGLLAIADKRYRLRERNSARESLSQGTPAKSTAYSGAQPAASIATTETPS